MDVRETAREVKSKREFGGNKGGTWGGGSGGGNSVTGVLIGGSGATVSPMHVGTQSCVLVRSFSSPRLPTMPTFVGSLVGCGVHKSVMEIDGMEESGRPELCGEARTIK